MSMHMHHPGLSTLNTGKNKKKVGAKQQKALAEHEKWLRARGIHTEQITNRKPRTIKIEEPIAKPDSTVFVKSHGNGFAPIVSKPSVFDTAWNKAYEDDPVMAEREAIARQKAIDKKSRIAPAYSKGAYQYISEGTDLKDIGKKK